MTATEETRRLTRKGQATHDRIVAAAAELMVEHGVTRTTVEDVQAAAAVSPSQLYHYFPGKDALVSAVIEYQTGRVLDVQQQGLDQLDSLDALGHWRDLMLNVVIEMQCVGGCPLGSLAADLADSDPVARVQLANAFASWQDLIRRGLTRMQERGELAATADPDALSVTLLATVQGGLLLSQVRRDPEPLRVAVDTMIDHLRLLTRS